jgi:exoribonuclease R
MPGSKFTMLPDAVVERYTLASGRAIPAVSLYLTVTPELEIVGDESRLEIVPVVANLRHHDIEPLFNEQTLAGGLAEFPFRDELLTLWQLANACEGRRGKAIGDAPTTRISTSASRAISATRKAVASRFPRAVAAARSTSWSPN